MIYKVHTHTKGSEKSCPEDTYILFINWVLPKIIWAWDQFFHDIYLQFLGHYCCCMSTIPLLKVLLRSVGCKSHKAVYKRSKGDRWHIPVPWRTNFNYFDKWETFLYLVNFSPSLAIPSLSATLILAKFSCVSPINFLSKRVPHSLLCFSPQNDPIDTSAFPSLDSYYSLFFFQTSQVVAPFCCSWDISDI